LNQDSAASTYSCSAAAAATRLADLQLPLQPVVVAPPAAVAIAPLVAAAVQQLPAAAAAAAAASCQLPAVVAASCQVPTVAVAPLAAAAAASCPPWGMDQPGSVGLIMGQPGPSTDGPDVKVGGNAGPDVNTCCICKEAYVQGKERQAMECMHVFHQDCIQEYMRISGLSFRYACPFQCFHEEIRVAQALQDAEDEEADPEPARATAISVPAPDELLQAAIAIA
jgi:hypothetical protein